MNRPHIIILLLALTSTSAAVADVHNVTWVRKAVSPGTVVKLGTQDFVLVRLPMKEFTNGNRYVVEYLAPVVDAGPPVAFMSEISTIHGTGTFAAPVTISGYEASIDLSDGRSYQYNANMGWDDGLLVETHVYGSVMINVGDTMLNLGTVLTALQQDLTAVSPDFSASPFAQWGAYTDPTALVSSFDNWIDYIRVLKIN